MTPPGGQRRRILGQSKHETKQTNGGKQNSLPVLLLGNNAGTKDAARRRVCWGGPCRNIVISLPHFRSSSQHCRSLSLRTLCRVPGEAIKGSGLRFADSQAAGQRAQSVLSRSRWKKAKVNSGQRHR